MNITIEHTTTDWRSEFACIDCGYDTFRIEYYMVHDDLWRTANPQIQGMLCVGCLEKRIGRKLVNRDFTDAPVNYGAFPQSRRLLSRIKSK